MEEYVKYRLVPVTYVFLLAAISVAAMVAGYCVLLRQKKGLGLKLVRGRRKEIDFPYSFGFR